MSRLSRRQALAVASAAPAAALAATPAAAPTGRRLPLDDVFRRNVRAEMASQQLTVAELAERAELSVEDVSAAIHGQGALSLDVADALARGLCFSLEAFVRVHAPAAWEIDLPESVTWSPARQAKVRRAMARFRSRLLGVIRAKGKTPAQATIDAGMDPRCMGVYRYAGDMPLDAAYVLCRSLGVRVGDLLDSPSKDRDTSWRT